MNTLGKKFVSTSLSPGQILEILSPSANPAGAVIRTANLGTKGAGFTSIITDTAAPESIPDANNRRHALTVWPPDTGFGFANMPFPLELGAGIGIWAVCSTLTTVTGVTLTYDVFTE